MKTSDTPETSACGIRTPIKALYLEDDQEQKHSELEVAALRDQLAAELAAMNRLHKLSVCFLGQEGLQALLDSILDAAISITGAEKGHVQLQETASRELGVAAQHGFDPTFVEFFSHIGAGTVACGVAMQTRQCVIVEDVAHSSLFLAEPEALRLMLQAGARAVVCTPLLTRAGQLVGVLSVHFGAPHRPSDRDLRLLDLLARQASDYIEHTQAQRAFRRQNAISQGINRLFREALACQTEEELGCVCLAIAEELTQSRSGFIGEINSQGQLDDIAISAPDWAASKAGLVQGHTGYRIAPGGFEIHGIYGRVLLDGKGFFTNDPPSHPDKVGLPEGHPPLTAFLGAPLVWGEKTVGMVGLANRLGGYQQEQLETLEVIAPAIAQVLMRHKAEQALASTQAQLQMITNNMAAGVIRCDRDSRYVWVSPAYARWLKRSPEEFVGRPMAEIIGAPAFNAIQPHLEQVLAGEKIEYEGLLNLPGLGPAWIHAVNTPTYDASGVTDGWVAVVTDITRRKEFEATKARLAAIVESSDDAIISKDLNGVVTSWNRGAEGLFGYRPAEIIGQPITRIIPPDLRGEETDILNRLRRGEYIHHFETERVAKDGRRINVSLTISPVRNEAGQIIGASKTCRNITERKRREQALRQATEELARTNEDLEEKVEERTAKLQDTVAELEGFSYSLVHDLRAPLRAMLGFASLVEEGQASPQEFQDYLRRIKESANRMDRLITDALNFSKIAVERMPIQPVDLAGLLRGMIDSYPDLQPPRAEIELKIHELMVLGNEAIITQCFSSLLNNAVKFVASGVKPRVRIWAEPIGGGQGAEIPDPQSGVERMRIWVEDNGIGIPREAHEKIFTMFQRLHHEWEYPGTGIGLAIVRKAAQRMGGSVGVLSESGKGSRFWIELSAASEQRSELSKHRL